MAESLKDIIEKIKLQKNSQQSNPEQFKPAVTQIEEKPVEKEIPISIEEDEDEEENEPEKKEGRKLTEEEQTQQRILMEIEMLQNNGRYRAEMLNQLQEINKALVVIAGQLVNLSGNGK